MKIYKTAIILIFLFNGLQSLGAQDFLRNLPDERMINSINLETFKFQDAVIILKEQSYKVDEETRLIRGVEYSGNTSTFSSIIIAKILNEKAILRYGSFSYSYSDYAGEEWPGMVSILVRVRKPDGTIKVMDQSEIKRIDEGRERDQYLRKVVFKVPDLAVNDVIQIEFAHNNPLVKTISRIFFYSDQDYVLYSNLYITLRQKDEANYYSFPQEEVGEPKIEQISDNFGAGRTYFWSAKNIRPVKKENFSLPFSDQSLITVFTPKRYGIHDIETWQEISANYFKNRIDGLSLSNSEIEKLGFNPDLENAGLGEIDSLYKVIKSKVTLLPSPSIYPYEDLDDIFEKNEGDVADLAGLFYKIVSDWGVPAKMILVRDQRDGNLELSAPSLSWFSRAAVRIELNGKIEYYDFDKALSSTHEYPWYLYGAQVLIIDEKMGSIEQIPVQVNLNEHSISEVHDVDFRDDFSGNEKLSVSFKGSFAQELRNEISSLSESDLKKYMSSHFLSQSISKPDSVTSNDFRNKPNSVWTFSGSLKNQPEVIDEAMIFRPSVNSLSLLKKDLFNPVRFGYIKFNTPFTYYIQHQIEIKKGMSLKELPTSTKFTGPAGANSQVTVTQTDQYVNILTEVNVPVNLISTRDYQSLTQFFDKTLAAATREIVFVPIKN